MGGLLKAVCDPCRAPAVGPITGGFATGLRPPRIMEGAARHRAPRTSRWEGRTTFTVHHGGTAPSSS